MHYLQIKGADLTQKGADSTLFFLKPPLTKISLSSETPESDGNVSPFSNELSLNRNLKFLNSYDLETLE